MNFTQNIIITVADLTIAASMLVIGIRGFNSIKSRISMKGGLKYFEPVPKVVDFALIDSGDIGPFNLPINFAAEEYPAVLCLASLF